jgi:hypothetical protein
VYRLTSRKVKTRHVDRYNDAKVESTAETRDEGKHQSNCVPSEETRESNSLPSKPLQQIVRSEFPREIDVATDQESETDQVEDE